MLEYFEAIKLSQENTAIITQHQHCAFKRSMPTLTDAHASNSLSQPPLTMPKLTPAPTEIHENLLKRTFAQSTTTGYATITPMSMSENSIPLKKRAVKNSIDTSSNEECEEKTTLTPPHPPKTRNKKISNIRDYKRISNIGFNGNSLRCFICKFSTRGKEQFLSHLNKFPHAVCEAHDYCHICKDTVNSESLIDEFFHMICHIKKNERETEEKISSELKNSSILTSPPATDDENILDPIEKKLRKIFNIESIPQNLINASEIKEQLNSQELSDILTIKDEEIIEISEPFSEKIKKIKQFDASLTKDQNSDENFKKSDTIETSDDGSHFSEEPSTSRTINAVLETLCNIASKSDEIMIEIEDSDCEGEISPHSTPSIKVEIGEYKIYETPVFSNNPSNISSADNSSNLPSEPIINNFNLLPVSNEGTDEIDKLVDEVTQCGDYDFNVNDVESEHDSDEDWEENNKKKKKKATKRGKISKRNSKNKNKSKKSKEVAQKFIDKVSDEQTEPSEEQTVESTSNLPLLNGSAEKISSPTHQQNDVEKFLSSNCPQKMDKIAEVKNIEKYPFPLINSSPRKTTTINRNFKRSMSIDSRRKSTSMPITSQKSIEEKEKREKQSILINRLISEEKSSTPKNSPCNSPKMRSKSPHEKSIECSQSISPPKSLTLSAIPPLAPTIIPKLKPPTVIPKINIKAREPPFVKNLIKLSNEMLMPWEKEAKKLRCNEKYELAYNAMKQKDSLISLFKCMGLKCSFTTDDHTLFCKHLCYHKEINDFYHCCSYCAFKHSNLKQLVHHIQNVHAKDNYQCSYCFYRSCESANVETHQTLHHTRKKIVIYQGSADEYLKKVKPFIYERLQRKREKFVTELRCKCELKLNFLIFF